MTTENTINTETLGNEDKENDIAINEEEATNDNQSKQINAKSCQFAMGRIKTIMKLDPDLALASKESVFLVTKATELFVEFISKESYKFTSQAARKTIQKKDIDAAINSVDSLCFLDAALD